MSPSSSSRNKLKLTCCSTKTTSNTNTNTNKNTNSNMDSSSPSTALLNHPKPVILLGPKMLLLLAATSLVLATSPTHQMVVHLGSQTSSAATPASGVPSMASAEIPPQNSDNSSQIVPLPAAPSPAASVAGSIATPPPSPASSAVKTGLAVAAAAASSSQVQRLPNINIYISKNEIKKLLGIDTKIHYVTSGIINTYPLGFTIPLGYNQSDMIFTWQNLGQTEVNYSISLVIGDKDVVDPPLINITRSGQIPKQEQVFRITLPCSGRRTDEVDVQVLMNITGYVAASSTEDSLDGAASLGPLESAAAPSSANSTSLEGEQADEPAGAGAGAELRLVSHKLAIKRKKICAMHPLQVTPNRPSTPLARLAGGAPTPPNRWLSAGPEPQPTLIRPPQAPQPLPASARAAAATPRSPPPQQVLAQLAQPALAPASVVAGPAAPRPPWRPAANLSPPPPDPANPLTELLAAGRAGPLPADQQPPVQSAELWAQLWPLVGALVGLGLLALLVVVAAAAVSRGGVAKSSHLSAAPPAAKHNNSANNNNNNNNDDASPLDKLANLLAHGPFLGFSHSSRASSATSSARSSHSGSPVSRKSAGRARQQLQYHLSQPQHHSQTLIVGLASANKTARQRANQPPPPPFYYKPNPAHQNQSQLQTGAAADSASCFYSFGPHQQQQQQQQQLATPTADLLGTGYQCHLQRPTTNLYHQLGPDNNQPGPNQHLTRLVWSQHSDGFAVDPAAYMPLSETNGSVYQTIS